MPQTECCVFHPEAVKKVLGKLAGDLELLRMAEQFQCFADPTRLKIINALLISELCVCDLTRVLNMTQPAVSHHLRLLRQSRLVKSRRDGKSILYSLDDHHVKQLFDICQLHLAENTLPSDKEI